MIHVLDLRLFIDSKNSFSVLSSRADVASSKRRTGASDIIALAIAIL